MFQDIVSGVVEVVIRDDGKVIWVNVDGKCALRICGIKYFELDDRRPFIKLEEGYAESLEEALKELVDLKTMKDNFDNSDMYADAQATRDDYELRQPLAWERARKLVANASKT